jgi:isocitrate lyase
VNCGVEQGIDRGLSYAPYADLIWMETSNPDLDYARKFAEGIHAKFPGKMLAYNCSPSFNWAAKLSVAEMETFREDLAAMGYKFQFITLAGFHALNTSMFELSKAYKERGMAGYSELQEENLRCNNTDSKP